MDELSPSSFSCEVTSHVQSPPSAYGRVASRGGRRRRARAGIIIQHAAGNHQGATEGCHTTEASNCNASRRDLLEAGVVASIATLLPRGFAAAEPAESSRPLITKTIPASGEKIPAIGIGTDSFSDSVRDDIHAELKRMSELGGTVIDTAASYGDSEALIGQALESLGTRERMFIATKLGWCIELVQPDGRRQLPALARAVEDLTRRAPASTQSQRGRGADPLAAGVENGRKDSLHRRNHLQGQPTRSEEHTSELQSRVDLVCRLLLEKKKINKVNQ